VKEAEPDLTAALDAFIKKFSYPAEQGLLIRNLLQHPVHARADRGNAAAYFSFPDMQNLEAHISEIPPGGATPTHRHTCEAFFYVISGSGYTEIRASGETEKRLEWQSGDLFCTPINMWHRHVNRDPLRAARYLEITTIPLMKSSGDWRIEAENESRSPAAKSSEQMS
jgi:gentisate 1,2-dioxygenase